MPRLLCTHKYIPLVLFLVLPACTEPTVPLRIGTIPWPGYEFLHLADELGYFTDEGVDVRLVEFTSLTDTRRAFERGQLDAWATSLVELLQSRERSGRRSQAFLVLDCSNGADVILARPPITSVADLRGKRVAAEPGTLDVVLLYWALRSVALTFADIHLVPIPQSQVPRAFARGEVDAAVTYPPNATMMLRHTDARKIFDSTQVPNAIVDVLAADADLLAKRSPEFAAITKAFERARRYAVENPDKALPIMARYENITPKEMGEALSGMRTVPLAEQVAYFKTQGLLEEALHSVDTSLRATGLLQGKEHWRDSYTDIPLREALRQ